AMPTPPAVVDATFALLPPLLGMLERIAWAQRHLYPPVAGRLADELARSTEGVAEPLAALEAVAWPADLGFMRDRPAEVTRGTLDLIKAFEQAARAPDDFIGLYRAVRRFSGVQERLYPLAPALEPVSRWFLDPERRGDDALIARLGAAALREDEVQVGGMHSHNEREARGGCSLYVPQPRRRR